MNVSVEGRLIKKRFSPFEIISLYIYGLLSVGFYQDNCLIVSVEVGLMQNLGRISGPSIDSFYGYSPFGVIWMVGEVLKKFILARPILHLSLVHSLTHGV